MRTGVHKHPANSTDDLRASLALASEGMLNRASRHGEKLAISVGGQVVLIEAKVLKKILATFRKEGCDMKDPAIEQEILQFGRVVRG